MKKLLAVLASLAMLSLVVAGCGLGKTAADAAIAMAQTSFDAAKDNAMKIAPDQATAIQTSIDAAKASAEKGEYKAAIEAAKAIPDQVKAMTDGLAAKEQELRGNWTQMQSLSGAVDQFKTQVDKLAAMKHLPNGMDMTKVEAAKATLANMTQAWGEAQAAFQAGNLAEAVSKAGSVKSMLTEGMTAVGMQLPDALKS